MMSINRYTLHHALAIGLAVFSAFIVNHYFSFSHEIYMVISAFFVCQTTRGTPVKQAMIIFLIMVAALTASSLLLINIRNYQVIYVLLAVLFIASAYLSFIYRPQSNKLLFLTLLFSMVVLISTLSPIMSAEFMQNRLMDVVIGAFIGVACAFIVAPVNLERELSEGILPVLSCLSEYTQSLSETLLAPQNYKANTSLVREKVERALQGNLGVYPVWVYEAGFNRGLRYGFRFFLINVERVTEIYFSMDYLISRGMDGLIMQGLYANINNVMQKNQELLSILTEYFKYKKIEYTQSDFTSDMAELEKNLHQIVPDNLEALDISPQFLLVTAFIRDLKDLRGLLLQLVMALPATKH